MVRTKADSGARKAVAAKAPRKVLGGGSSAGSSSTSAGSPSASKNNKYSGGNSAHPRPTPEWQKGIGGFLRKENKEDADHSAHEEQESPRDKTGTDYSSEPEDVQSGSSSSQKKAQISSDEDDD